MSRIAFYIMFIGSIFVFYALKPVGVKSGFDDENLQNCAFCHYDSKSILGNKHPEIEVAGIMECLVCHEPKALRGKAEPNPFSAKLHMAHINEEIVLSCLDCHTWTEGKTLGLPGSEISFGELSVEDMKFIEEVFISWSTSSFTDNLHGKANITCSSCHGESLPKRNLRVPEKRCLTCHGPMSTLIKQTTYEGFPGRNPHDSHLGPLDCSICHSMHSASRSYCLECHRDFEMKIPGG